jgi:hypothetical protein
MANGSSGASCLTAQSPRRLADPGSFSVGHAKRGSSNCHNQASISLIETWPTLEQPRGFKVCHNAPASMPFFLIVPVWLLCVLCGIVLICFQRFRRIGLYAISISTAATAISLLLSTTVLFLGPRVGLQRMGRWSGIALIGAYVLAIGVGALIGALGGFLLTRKLLPHT